MMMTMMSCLSVCNVVYCGQTVAYFSYFSAELLFIDSGVYVGQFLPLLLLPHAAQNRGGNCIFNLLYWSMNLPRL